MHRRDATEDKMPQLLDDAAALRLLLLFLVETLGFLRYLYGRIPPQAHIAHPLQP